MNKKLAASATMSVAMASAETRLSENITLLGVLLDKAILEVEGEEISRKIAAIRQAALRFHQTHDQQASLDLEQLLAGLSLEHTVRVVRALAYFKHLVNLAEDLYGQQLGHCQQNTPAPGMLSYTLLQIKEAGIPADTIKHLLEDALISPVLTAHPTEVQRKSVLDIERLIAELLAARAAMVSERQLARNTLLLQGAVSALWQTRMMRYSKLSVLNEIENALTYYESTFLHVIPEILQDIECDLADVLPDAALPGFLRMGSWIGGDRDGNPFVNGGTLRESVRLQAITLFKFYLQELSALKRELAVSTRVVGVDDAVLQLSKTSRDQSQHRLDEPYRLALNGIHDRLLATANTLLPQGGWVLAEDMAADPYETPEALLAPLQTIADSLRAHQGEALIYPRLGKLIKAIATFGFHLATVDIRQSSDVHEAVITELLQKAGHDFDYAGFNEDEKIGILLEELKQPRLLFSPFQQYSELVHKEIGVLVAVREMRERFGEHAVRQYIISHTETLSDLLEVALLQREAGLLRGVWGSANIQVDLNIVPLFETIADLRDAPMIMGHHGATQRHGDGQIRLTEQGEIISTRYADPVVGRQHLETLIAATLDATLFPADQLESGKRRAFEGVMETLSATAMTSYRSLVYETPGFAEYFFNTTPINEIAELNLGSRPAARKSTRRIEDLRAIPWGFSWGQCRLLLPGWYGLGSAIHHFLQQDPALKEARLAMLLEMQAHWPLFNTLIQNVDMVLAKTDLIVARHYAHLLEDRELREEIFSRIAQEHKLTTDAVNLLLGTTQRLATQPVIAKSIRDRLPYLDPMNHLQVEMIQRYRNGETDEKLKWAIPLTINGIATSLRNTG
ncbi:Phosphoenolpyruvate carboxylase, putative [Ricinus communis]|uniref:Phosphoenolpyruvate carboxylase, putative n=1 Tax=Ricinus communis TaxID=3988 RepID=B9T8D2_RICCO|nr:Phosphoenolpyruvate carboxylase, putative [Ricinus communis]